jgi:hypothetical protein
MRNIISHSQIFRKKIFTAEALSHREGIKRTLPAYEIGNNFFCHRDHRVHRDYKIPTKTASFLPSQLLLISKVFFDFK